MFYGSLSKVICPQSSRKINAKAISPTSYQNLHVKELLYHRMLLPEPWMRHRSHPNTIFQTQTDPFLSKERLNVTLAETAANSFADVNLKGGGD